MNERNLYTFKNGNDTYYFLEHDGKYIGGDSYYEPTVEEFIAAAKIFGTELIEVELKDPYYITNGEPIYKFSDNTVILYTPEIADANSMIKGAPILIKRNMGTQHRSGIPYIITPLQYRTDGFVRAYIFDRFDNKFEIEYNIDTWEARNARRL